MNAFYFSGTFQFSKLAFECSLLRCVVFFLVIIYIASVGVRWQKNRNETKPYIMIKTEKLPLLELESKLINRSQRGDQR